MFLIKGEPHPFCKNKCEQVTMCGEVQVPEEHLHVSAWRPADSWPRAVGLGAGWGGGASRATGGPSV